MDKEITAEVAVQKKEKLIITLMFVAVCVTAAIAMLRTSIKTAVNNNQITTAVVETGDIENTLTATGEVLPEFEEIITSPINATIQSVSLDAGSNVKSAQSLLTLDKSTTLAEFEKLKFQLESKRNSIKKLKLELDKSFYDLKSNNDIKKLKINSYKAEVENAKRLYKAGGGTREDIEQAELNLKVAQLEKSQLENEIKSRQQTMQVEMRESEIAAAIQENDLKELERKLQRASVVASRDGVVTWINKNIGATVQEGESIARIADLSSFKVTGSISDSYLDQLHRGMQVIVKVNEAQIRGIISNIYPAVQNGVVSFDIQLNERNDKVLRPNLKVDVYLVTDIHTNILRVANGTAFKSATTQDVFVVKNGKAEKHRVEIGMTNFDYVEIKGDIHKGDVVITSDMSDYKNTSEITIKQ